MTDFEPYELLILQEYRTLHKQYEFETLCERFCHEGLSIRIQQGWMRAEPDEYKRQGIKIEDGSIWIASICSHEETGKTRFDAIRKLADWIVAEERLGC